MSISQAFDTFTDLLAESEHEDSVRDEMENHFKDIWHEEYYDEEILSLENIKQRNIKPLHTLVYEAPYPIQYKDKKVIVVAYDYDRNEGLILDGNHRFNTASLMEDKSEFKVIIFYVGLPT